MIVVWTCLPAGRLHVFAIVLECFVMNRRWINFYTSTKVLLGEGLVVGQVH